VRGLADGEQPAGTPYSCSLPLTDHGVDVLVSEAGYQEDLHCSVRVLLTPCVGGPA
jgi:hypothetical protein